MSPLEWAKAHPLPAAAAGGIGLAALAALVLGHRKAPSAEFDPGAYTLPVAPAAGGAAGGISVPETMPQWLRDLLAGQGGSSAPVVPTPTPPPPTDIRSNVTAIQLPTASPFRWAVSSTGIAGVQDRTVLLKTNQLTGETDQARLDRYLGYLSDPTAAYPGSALYNVQQKRL